MAGNSNSGRRQEKPFRDALRMEALSAERGDPCDAKPGSLRWNARKLLEQGDVPSIKELADRLDGKAVQQLDIEAKVNLSHEEALEQLAPTRSGDTPPSER